MIRKAALTAALIAMLAVAFAPSASATFPGSNGKIAYTNKKDQIGLVKSDGTGKETLTHFANLRCMEAPMFSADGRWIVFDGASATGDTDLYVMRSDGARLHKVTHTSCVRMGSVVVPERQMDRLRRRRGLEPDRCDQSRRDAPAPDRLWPRRVPAVFPRWLQDPLRVER